MFGLDIYSCGGQDSNNSFGISFPRVCLLLIVQRNILSKSKQRKFHSAFELWIDILINYTQPNRAKIHRQKICFFQGTHLFSFQSRWLYASIIEIFWRKHCAPCNIHREKSLSMNICHTISTYLHLRLDVLFDSIPTFNIFLIPRRSRLESYEYSTYRYFNLFDILIKK